MLFYCFFFFTVAEEFFFFPLAQIPYVLQPFSLNQQGLEIKHSL